MLLGNTSKKGIILINVINIDKGILLLVLLCNSLNLILINIKINKNKIETAPIYTIKYDNPIKINPDKIKYKDMLKNNAIKYITDIIGFLLIIINILLNIANIYNIFKKIEV
jgi:hypothetical protein